MVLRAAMKPVRSVGEISSGMELLRIFLSLNRMASRLVERAGADRMPLVFLTSLILSIGYHSHLYNRFLMPSLLPQIRYRTLANIVISDAPSNAAITIPAANISPSIIGPMNAMAMVNTTTAGIHQSIFDLYIVVILNAGLRYGKGTIFPGVRGMNRSRMWHQRLSGRCARSCRR